MFFIKFGKSLSVFSNVSSTSESLSSHIFSFNLFKTPRLKSLSAESGKPQVVSFCTYTVQAITTNKWDTPQTEPGVLFLHSSLLIQYSSPQISDTLAASASDLWHLSSLWPLCTSDLQLSVILLGNCPQAESWANMGSPCKLPFSQGSPSCIACWPLIENSCFKCVVQFYNCLLWEG